MRVAAVLALLAATLTLGSGPASARPASEDGGLPVTTYADPTFRCHFTRYGEGDAPPLTEAGTDPLCVEYSKRDITVTNGGAVGFVLAEPARFAIAVPACRYWQIDHWSVQVAPGDDALVRWDGSYWFDRGALTAAAAMRDFTIGGQPVSAQQAADAVRPASPELATAIEEYGVAGGFGMRLTPTAAVGCTAPTP